MFKWYRSYKTATPETKMFAFQWAVYLFLILATTIYCYARLDYVRSYAPPSQTLER